MIFRSHLLLGDLRFIPTERRDRNTRKGTPIENGLVDEWMQFV